MGGRSFDVPYYDALPLAQRRLPGINIQHPYLTISDTRSDTSTPEATCLISKAFLPDGAKPIK